MSFMKLSLPSPMVWNEKRGCGDSMPSGYFLASSQRGPSQAGT